MRIQDCNGKTLFGFPALFDDVFLKIRQGFFGEDEVAPPAGMRDEVLQETGIEAVKLPARYFAMAGNIGEVETMLHFNDLKRLMQFFGIRA